MAELAGTRIEGVPVLGTCGHARELAERHRVQQILVVQGELTGLQLRQLMEDVRPAACEVRVIPNYRQWIEGTCHPTPAGLDRGPVCARTGAVGRGRHPPVDRWAGDPGDRHRRQYRLGDQPPVAAVLAAADRSGGSGRDRTFFLERELQPLAGKTEIDVCVADVLDEPRMRRIFMQHRPHVIFHAAAYKHVPLMECHPEEAIQNIVTATRRMADLAAEYHTDAFVMISTDKAVNPTSVMGACKRAAELYIQSLADRRSTHFVTVRFGNVLDSAGSVVQLFRQQIAAGGPVTVTHPEMRRYFMTIPEAAGLVVQAGAIGQSGQILVLDMGEPVRIFDLAADMIRLSGLRMGDDIAIELTGLRPGEKLYEELHIPGERLLPTRHAKIIVADHRPRLDDIEGAIDYLEQLARQCPEAIVGGLQAIVSGYQPEAERPALQAQAVA